MQMPQLFGTPFSTQSIHLTHSTRSGDTLKYTFSTRSSEPTSSTLQRLRFTYVTDGNLQVFNYLLIYGQQLLREHLFSYTHRQGTEKYLDTLLANQTARKALSPTTARWRTARVIISPFLPNQPQQSSFAVIGYAEAGRRRSPMMCRLLYRRIPKFWYGKPAPSKH